MQAMGKRRKPSYAAMQAIWLGFLFAVFVYIFVAYQITKDRTWPPNPNLELFTVIVVILCIVDMVIAFIIWRKVPRWAIRKQIDNMQKDGGTSGQEQQTDRGLAAAQVAAIVVSAFCESCVIYGLALVFLGADLPTLIPFAAVTLISLLIFRPNRDFVERVMRKLDAYTGVRA